MKNHQPRLVYFFKKKHFFTFNYNGPEEFLYGFNHLKKDYHCCALFCPEEKNNLFYKILNKIIAQQTKLGIYFQAYLNNKKKMKDTDVLLAINDGASFGLLFFKLFGKINNQIIVLIQGLHDRYQYFSWNKPLIYFYQKLLEQTDCILTLSSFEKNLLIKLFHLNPLKVKVFYFGVDKNYWQFALEKNQKKDNLILTIGDDMHRDYDLLLKNYNLKFPLKFITNILTKEQLKIIKNNSLFENDENIPNDQLRKSYTQAKFIIVPLKKTLATSGLSVTLQALAMSKPVLLANAPALRELFVDRKHVLYYQTGSSSSFKQKLNELNNNKVLRNKLSKNGRKLVETKFNSQKMGENILKIIKNF